MASERADTGSATEALETGRRVIRAERAGLEALADSLDPAFAEAVALIGAASGRLIVCGVGKSGHDARKVSSTFASTGSSSRDWPELDRIISTSSAPMMPRSP